MVSEPSPPQYTSADDCPPVLLNLAPLADAVTFQRGLLGFTPAFIEGEVQIKFIGPADTPRPRFSKLEVCFRGVERSDRVEIELTEQRRVLWGEGASGEQQPREEDDDGSPEREAGGSAQFPPTSTHFKLELTPDLPHCLHLGPSSLEYSLTATLFYTDSSLAPITKCSPVHLIRTSPPGSLLAGSTIAASTDPPPSITPQTLEVSDPISLSVRLQRTVFRRSEPVELIARIEVPTGKAVREDGLRLRTVRAELVRKVTVVVVPADEGDAGPIGPSREEAERPDDLTPTPPPPLPVEPHVTVLARSGKSARFSPTRPIVIRLLLHPPSVISCESISQSTILHNITFSIRVTVGLFSQQDASRHDVTLSRTIYIVPDTPSSQRTEKQREVESDAETLPGWMPAEGPVPTYHESAEGSGSWGTDPSGSHQGVWNTSSGEPEEEYDGYEELSASLSSRPPPPTIDEDVSPPSASEQEESISLDLDEDDGVPPPPHELSSSSAASSLSASPHLSLQDEGPNTPPEEALPPPYIIPIASPTGGVSATGPPPYTSHQSGPQVELIRVTSSGEVLVELS